MENKVIPEKGDGEVIPNIIGIISVIFVLVLFLIPALTVIFSCDRYSGSLIMEENKQEYYENLISENGVFGPFGLWKPGYKIKQTDNGIIVFEYCFFAEKGQDLPFRKEGENDER